MVLLQFFFLVDLDDHKVLLGFMGVGVTLMLNPCVKNGLLIVM